MVGVVETMAAGGNNGNLGNGISIPKASAQCDEAVCGEKPISKISKMQENQANAGFYLGNPPFSNIFQFSNIGGSNDPQLCTLEAPQDCTLAHLNPAHLHTCTLDLESLQVCTLEP